MSSIDQKKCAHEKCTCLASSNSRFCSPACESGRARRVPVAAGIRIAQAPRQPL